MWIALVTAAALAAPALFLDDVRIVDALGPRGPVDVRIVDGVITEVGALDPGDDAVIAGGWVVPGLVDTHVHLSLAPGAAWRPPDADPAARRAHHLRAYLAAGVTTVLDPGILPDDARALATLAAAGPRFLYLGPLISPAGGYVASVLDAFPQAGTPDEARALFATFDGLAPSGVKVTLEDGPLFRIWPLHPPEVRAAIVDEAARRDRDLYVHAMSTPMVRLALEMAPHALVHTPMSPLPRRVAREVAASGAFVETTLAIAGSSLLEWEDLDAPWLTRLVPADELAAAASPEVHRAYRRAMLDTLAPRMPGVARGVALAVGTGRGALRGRVRRGARSVRQLHALGVPLALGSDAGNWPILPFLFHGPSTHLELAMLVEAGLTPLEALTAATLTPARMLRLDDAIGTVEPGKLADLVIVDSDPLDDVTVLRTPRVVIRDGVAGTPEQWSTPAP